MLRRHPLLALFAAVAMLPASLLAQLSFQAHQIGEPGAGSNIVAHGDFNNDGREDLVVLKLGTSIVDQLYLSNGDGTYGTPMTLPSLVQAVGDFNHDGNLDLAIMEAGGGVVSICLGNGNGTFQSPKALPDANVYISNVLAVDLNQDSKTDLIEVLAAESGSISMQLWISNGDGSFTKGQTIVSSTGQLVNETTSSVFTGDFDGDGKPDVALVYGFEIVNSRDSLFRGWFRFGTATVLVNLVRRISFPIPTGMRTLPLQLPMSTTMAAATSSQSRARRPQLVQTRLPPCLFSRATQIAL